MNASAAFALSVAIVLLALIGRAQAAHPLITDDTLTQGHGNQQLEVNADWRRGLAPESGASALTYSYGARDALDLYLNLPVAIHAPTGVGDASLGAKWRFWESDVDSVGIKSELSLPTGNEARGLGNGLAGGSLTLLASHRAARWALHGNAELALNRFSDPAASAANRRLLWRVSAAATFQLRPGLLLVGDTGVARNPETAARTAPAFALLGFIFSPRKNIDLDAGVKAGLNSAEAHRQFGVGLTWRF